MTQPASPCCRHPPLGPLLGLQVLRHNSIKLSELPQAHIAQVVVLNSNNPDTVLIGLGVGGVMQSPGVRAGLATALCREGDQFRPARLPCQET